MEIVLYGIKSTPFLVTELLSSVEIKYIGQNPLSMLLQHLLTHVLRAYTTPIPKWIISLSLKIQVGLSMLFGLTGFTVLFLIGLVSLDLLHLSR